VAPGDGPVPLRRGPVEGPHGHLQIQHRGLAVELAAGEHLGVVVTDGATAAGLLDVLGRDAEPDGVLRLDGTDLRAVSLAAARRAVLVARHDAALFEGTLADNLIVDADADAAKLAPALAASAADEVRDTLPDGLATEIGERGRTLSGGQRQRVALARALAAEPTVLVLHDPTTAIDAATEDRIAAGLHRLRAGRSTLLVTSSPALLARCDRVVLIRDGAVSAEGTHASLVDDPAYRAAVLS
jgi:putative ABC transport system ATP-binding protein